MPGPGGTRRPRRVAWRGQAWEGPRELLCAVVVYIYISTPRGRLEQVTGLNDAHSVRLRRLVQAAGTGLRQSASDVSDTSWVQSASTAERFPSFPNLLPDPSFPTLLTFKRFSRSSDPRELMSSRTPNSRARLSAVLPLLSG